MSVLFLSRALLEGGLGGWSDVMRVRLQTKAKAPGTNQATFIHAMRSSSENMMGVSPEARTMPSRKAMVMRPEARGASLAGNQSTDTLTET